MRAKRYNKLLPLIFFGLLPLSALAEFTINFNGTLVASEVIEPPPLPDCTIDGSSIVEVDFGDVYESLIDNESYKRTAIPYILKCNGVYKNELKMTLTWNSSTINGRDVVRTNLTNLGIAISLNNIPLYSGIQIPIRNDGPRPPLFAVPVKPAGINLTDSGGFVGIITMVIDYE